MTPIGIDIGGTKIEAQVFRGDWSIRDRRRVATPSDYAALVQSVAELGRWARAIGGQEQAVGVSLAGLVNRETGLGVTANLPAIGRRVFADLRQAIGGDVVFENDCRAFALSEALLGAGRDYDSVVGLIIGTGVGGGFVKDGRLLSGAGGLAGEYGHIGIGAAVLQTHGLPVLKCKCGREGCYETYVSGPGMARMAKEIIGHRVSSIDIAGGRGRRKDYAAVWTAWCDLAAELIFSLTLTLDPQVVVLGGGVSKADGVIEGLSEALDMKRFHGMPLPGILRAEGGDASGARGAGLLAQNERDKA